MTTLSLSPVIRTFIDVTSRRLITLWSSLFFLFQDKLTESNYTLGALSPESAELIGQLDPVLGSIAAPRQPGAVASSLGVSINAEEIEEESDEDLLRSTDLDLGFYFGSSSNSNSDEEDQEAKEANVDSLSEQLEASLEDMIQTAQMHPRSLQVRRERNMECGR